jgi:uncharacterized membrane-anchored protein
VPRRSSINDEGDIGAMRPLQLTRPSWHKVPEIVLLFWVVKLLSTAMGEAFSDYLVFHVNPYLAVVAATLGLTVALAVQLRASRYEAPFYWLAVVMVAVFGTMVADVLHVVLDVPYAVSAAGLAATLAVVFVAWHRVEGTLSIHSIDTPRRELFYWATVMATFALGTAAGDLTAATLGLGYPASALLFAVAFAVPGSATGSWAGTRSRRSGPRTSSPGRWALRSRTGWAKARSVASGSATRSSRSFSHWASASSSPT